MVRSSAPSVGWHPVLRIANKCFLWLVLGLILPFIVIIVLRVKKPTLDHVQTASKVVSRLAQTYFLVIAFGSAVLLAIAAYSERARGGVKDPFGRGSWNGKLLILCLSVTLATVEAGFRCGTTWSPARFATNPAWWDSQAAFYCFNFTIDICILILFAAGRIDRRLHVPDGASGRKSYGQSGAFERRLGAQVRGVPSRRGGRRVRPNLAADACAKPSQPEAFAQTHPPAPACAPRGAGEPKRKAARASPIEVVPMHDCFYRGIP